MLYKDWLADWLSNYIMPSAKDKTYSRYVDIIDRHLQPKLGNYMLEELTPLIVQRFITELSQSGNLKSGDGLSANSINSIITVIQGSLRTAHFIGLTEKYEMDKLKRPHAKERVIEYFSISEHKSIESAVMSDRRQKMTYMYLCAEAVFRTCFEKISLKYALPVFPQNVIIYKCKMVGCGLNGDS